MVDQLLLFAVPAVVDQLLLLAVPQAVAVQVGAADVLVLVVAAQDVRLVLGHHLLLPRG